MGFISNGKEGTKGYFTHLERMLREELSGRGRRGVAHEVELQRPADAHIVDEIKRWHAVVAGVGD